MPETSVPRYLFLNCDPKSWEQSSDDPAVIICDGIQTYMRVRNGQLQIADGMSNSKRTRTIYRMPHTVKRVVILGSAGYVTLEAQRWLSDAKIPWVILDKRDDKIVATSGTESSDARLIRAQCNAAPGNPLEMVGLEVTRLLISEKIRGQLANVSEFFTLPDTEIFLKNRLAEVEQAETFEQINGAEGQAASAYWQAWQSRVFVPFSPTDLLKVPAHWQCFSQRHSLAHDYEKNKDATDPIGATLNYLYRIGESEAVHACHSLGLLPNLGINHLDKSGRDSLALDLLECIRPVCDRIALQIFGANGEIPYRDGKPAYFDRRFVEETREGIVRLEMPYTHRLASHAVQMSQALMPHAHAVAQMLARAASGQVTVRQLVKREKAPSQTKRYYPKVHVRPGIKPADVIPDSLWSEIHPMLTVRPAGNRGRKPAPPTRALLAALVLREICRVPWPEVGVKQDTCQVWLNHWQSDQTWPRVQAAITEGRDAHLAALVIR